MAIVGLGLIGGSVALDLKNKIPGVQIIGVDMNERHCQMALALKIVNEVKTIEQAVIDAELVILAIPVDALIKVLPIVLGLLEPGCTLMDMGSTKSLICDQVKYHPKRGQFVASHPMAGTENSGPGAAKEALFAGHTAVICEAQKSHPAHLAHVENLYDILKMRLVYMEAKEHDVHIAYISHLSHICSFVLANTILAKETDISTIFNLAGGGFESTVRLAKSSPEMWCPIFAQNKENILFAVESFREHLNMFYDALQSEDCSLSFELIRTANGIRKVWSQ